MEVLVMTRDPLPFGITAESLDVNPLAGMAFDLRLFTVDEVHALTGASVRSILRDIAAGHIRAMIRGEDLREYYERVRS
jgi:hypothetical protein